MHRAHLLWLLAIVVGLAAAAPAQAPAAPAAPPEKNSCLECHSALDGPLGVPMEKFSGDVHARAGLSCVGCHGGDPTSDENAMSRAAGFKGAIERKKIPELCGSCHSDAAYMHKFNPKMRTDQLAQYKTSEHGKKLAKGDVNVAVCTDCHGLHETRPATDLRSQVHPLNIAKTCSSCHSDVARMKPYGLPTDQYAGYEASVHHKAMAVRGDLSAPTCTTCHGNHGAAPPGVASVEMVCSSCHVFQAQLFDTSPHKAAFAAAGMAPCVTCHSNHRITEPSDAMLGKGPQSICTNCHSEGDTGLKVAVAMQEGIAALYADIQRAEAILERAERSGMEVGQAKLDQSQARDALTKARVTIHAASLARLEQDLDPGRKVAEKSYQAGEQAMKERDYRRMGLGVSVLTILAVLIGLRLVIKDLESRNGTNR